MTFKRFTSRSRALTILVALVVGLTGALVVPSPASAACVEYADVPFWDGTYLYGYGGRQGCSAGVNFDVHLRQDVFGPDHEWGTAWGTGNADLLVWIPCYYDGNYRTFFIETRVQGRKIRSGDGRWPCQPWSNP